MSIHEAYRRLLARPDVQRLARRFGLDRHVHYEFVGERRSFHGKAQTVEGRRLVRLPSNVRPEPYLLLTLLHEWAHLLVQEQRRTRRVMPHGPEWQKQYEAVLKVAVAAGLFAGNEAEVVRHASAGEARTQYARLLGPDGAPLLPEPERQHERERPVPQFTAGDGVQFRLPDGRVVAGTIRRVNPRTYTVAPARGPGRSGGPVPPAGGAGGGRHQPRGQPPHLPGGAGRRHGPVPGADQLSFAGHRPRNHGARRSAGPRSAGRVARGNGRSLRRRRRPAAPGHHSSPQPQDDHRGNRVRPTLPRGVRLRAPVAGVA